MAFVHHIIPRGKRDFSKIHLRRDTSHCILYVKLQSLRDTPKYNAIIKIFCTDPFSYDWNHLEWWNSEIDHFHFPHWLRASLVQVGLDIISVQLAQQSTVSKERTKFRRVDDIEKRGQRRALRKAMRGGDPLGPRGPMDHAEGAGRAAIEE